MSDPFDTLEITPAFDIDRAIVQQRYLRLLATLHPDRQSDPLARREAEGHAAAVNEARDVLLDDERRAGALLERLGGPASKDDKTLPDGFLMEIMSVREEMAEALATGVAEDRRRFEGWAADARDAHLGRIRALFARCLEAETPATADLAAIRVELNALRYIERMIEQLDPDHVTLL